MNNKDQSNEIYPLCYYYFHRNPKRQRFYSIECVLQMLLCLK